MDLGLKDHVAIVTGAASGIGRAAAMGFAAEGAHVALWDVSDQVNAIAEEIAKRYQVQTLGLRVDLADESAVHEAVKRTLSHFGTFHHVVHSAAINSGKFGFPFSNLSPSDWKKVLDVNVMGTVHVAHAAAPHLVEQKRGTMVFLASVAGQIGSQTDPPYSASKAANINFAQCLAKDLAPHGVRVNSVCPGMVKTALNHAVWQAWNDRQLENEKRSYEEWAEEKVKKVVPLGTWQRPEDVADLIVFLSSERAGQITGQTVNVDGGYVMHW